MLDIITFLLSCVIVLSYKTLPIIMKCLVTALLLGLFSTALVSARSGLVKHHRPDAHDEGSPRHSSGRLCEREINSCFGPALKYSPGRRSKLDDHVLLVRDAGAKQVCSDLVEVGKCIMEKVNTPVCEITPDIIKTQLLNGLDLAHRICSDDIDELEKHWNCLLNISMLYVLPQCLLKARESFEDCNPALVVNCVVDLYGTNGNCEAGAPEFIHQYGTEAVEIYHLQKCPVLMEH